MFINDILLLQPLKVVIYEENSYKRININALLVWEGCAQPKDDNVPFCKRVEYFNGKIFFNIYKKNPNMVSNGLMYNTKKMHIGT